MRRGSCVVSLLAVLGLGVLARNAMPVAATQGGGPKILRVQWASEMPDLEPQTNENGISDLTLLNYEGLTRLDQELNVVPGAAESWEFDAAGTTITFHLRPNLTYSDGSPLTAERFRYAIKRRCDPHLTSWGANALFDIVGCEELNTSLGKTGGTPTADSAAYEAAKANLGVRALDDRTLEIELKQPAPYFPALAQWIGFIPVKQELIEPGGAEWWRDSTNWIGNGPFQVTAIAPDRITLARNERYWGGRANLDGIEYTIVPDEQHALDAYTRGDLDVVYAKFDLIPQFEADPALSRELVAIPTLTADVFQFNLTKEPFNDKKVREAFAYAFDRETYCKTIDYTCRPVLSWIPQGIPGHIDTDAYAFDPAKARAALAASSYGGPERLPEITWYFVGGDAWNLRQAEWVRDQFHQVLGVQLTLQPITSDEEDAMMNDAATRQQMTDTYWWSGLADPHQWMQDWTCGDEVFAAAIGYCNPAYDALVAQADRERDPEKRIALAEESQRVLLADAPAIFTYTFDNIFLTKPDVTGYSRSAPNQSWPGLATPLTVDIERPA